MNSHKTRIFTPYSNSKADSKMMSLFQSAIWRISCVETTKDLTCVVVYYTLHHPVWHVGTPCAWTLEADNNSSLSACPCVDRAYHCLLCGCVHTRATFQYFNEQDRIQIQTHQNITLASVFIFGLINSKRCAAITSFLIHFTPTACRLLTRNFLS